MNMGATYNAFYCLSCSEQLSGCSQVAPLRCPSCDSAMIFSRECRKSDFDEDKDLMPVYLQSIAVEVSRSNTRMKRLTAESTLVEEFYRKGTITKEQAVKCRLDLRLYFYGF